VRLCAREGAGGGMTLLISASGNYPSPISQDLLAALTESIRAHMAAYGLTDLAVVVVRPTLGAGVSGDF
jgi:hypothetical protein